MGLISANFNLGLCWMKNTNPRTHWKCLIFHGFFTSIICDIYNIYKYLLKMMYKWKKEFQRRHPWIINMIILYINPFWWFTWMPNIIGTHIMNNYIDLSSIISINYFIFLIIIYIIYIGYFSMMNYYYYSNYMDTLSFSLCLLLPFNINFVYIFNYNIYYI